MMNIHTEQTKQRGFTIVEFMVATSVFSVVLMAVSAAVVYMGRTYQKSMYTTSTQAATATLVDTISQAIKFSSDSVNFYEDNNPATTDMLCVGNRQFLYVVGRQLGSTDPQTGSQHAVMTRPNQNCTAADIISGTPAPTTKGSARELLGRNMRLDRLTLTSSGGVWKVSARVVFGDDDLLCKSKNTTTDTCTSTSTLSDAELTSNDPANDLICKPQIGSQFCAVSELSNSVYRRL